MKKKKHNRAQGCHGRRAVARSLAIQEVHRRLQTIRERMSTLLLKLINQDGPGLRGGVDKDGVQAFSLFDLGNLACGKDRDSTYGKTNFYRLTKEGSAFKKEVDTLCIYLKFPGSGQRETPCATIRGLQRYLMMLGGKVAAEFREIIEGTFTRVMAGDQSLIEVINANAVSQAPVQQAFREALAQEPVAPVLDDACLGKKRERDEILIDPLAERRLQLEEAEFRLREREKALEHMNRGMELMDSLQTRQNIDERTKLQFEDHIKNVILSASSHYRPVKAITSGSPAVNETESLSVSVVAVEMGYKCSDREIINIGRAMARKYKEKYQRDPPKHKQYVKGNYVPVNSYMERDRGLMEQAVREIMGDASESGSNHS